MGFEFGFGGGDEFSTLATSLGANAVPDMPAPPSFSFGNLANTISSGAKAFGSGVKDALSPFADVAKGIAPVVGLAGTGLGIANSIQARNQAGEQNKIARHGLELQQHSAEAAASAAAPLTRFGADALARAQRGEIPPAMQAMIENWKTAQKAKMHQYLASIGQGNSEALREIDGAIDAKGVEMAAEMLQQEISQGTGALTGGAAAVTGAGGVAGSVQQNANANLGDLTKLIEDASQQMARLTGGQ